MALLSIFFFLSTIFLVTAQQNNSTINKGSFLTTTSKSMWLSPSGLYAFGFYSESNNSYRIGIFIVGVPQKTVVWTIKRDDARVSGDATLKFDTDGQIILQVKQNSPSLLIAQYASSASMLDSGNFVLYNYTQNIIWQSFDYPTDTIVSGQRLLAGTELVSSLSETDHSSGFFRLVMQTDGNLVQYPISTPNAEEYAYYSTRTGGVGNNVTLNLAADGHLYLFNSSGSNIKNISNGISSTKKTIYLMRIDPDGIFRLYSHGLDPNGTWSISWSSSSDKCDPKGLCGLNAYCVNDDDQVNCRCLPGFDFVNPDNRSSECERNFTINSCKSNDVATTYTIEELTKIIWEDNSYSVLQLPTKEDCEKACVKDCNCEAASFEDGNCKKLSFPLRFGRRLLDSSNVIFIKVGNSTISPTTKRVVNMLILVISVSIMVIALIILGIVGLRIRRAHVWVYKGNSKKVVEVGLREHVGPKCFSYSELAKATDGFKEEIGRGSFGTVFKGIILNPQKDIAVKRLNKVLEEGEREFQMEINVIGRTHHRNLVKLYGYCVEGTNRLLVYEYMNNGSLAELISNSEKKPHWHRRTKIVLNIARGLLYLHEECEIPIIHCDVKPQNILMDEYGNTKICDFGLAKLMKVDQTNTYTGLRGTRGYVAPEWYRKLPVTVKVDVYSFGIVLFEIICCRKGVDISLPEEQIVLEHWVYDYYEVGKLHNLVDEEDVDMKELERMIKVGLWCIQDEPSLRPSMKKVILMLEGTVDIPVPPIPTSFLSAT